MVAVGYYFIPFFLTVEGWTYHKKMLNDEESFLVFFSTDHVKYGRCKPLGGFGASLPIREGEWTSDSTISFMR